MAVKTTMLFDWFKKMKPYIRFYSLEPGVTDLYPIIKSSALKRGYTEVPQPDGYPSSKNCPGIKKVVSSGWIVTAPADFTIKTMGDGVRLEWAEPYRFSKVTPNMDAYVSAHGHSQTEPLLDDPANTLKTAVKLETPWRVEASEDIVLLQVPVAYNNESRFTAATGVLDTRYGHLLNVQLFWHVLEGETLVRAGTPLCQLIPVSRKMLSSSSYDVTIDNATEQDREKERKFNYAANCVFLNSDNLASRISRTLTILNKYKKED